MLASIATAVAEAPRGRPHPEHIVPMPATLEIAAPAADVPADLARWHGAWAGAWGEGLRHILVVETIAADGTAQIVSATADYAPFHVWGAWRRTRETIDAEGLVLSWPSGRAAYRLDGNGRLQGTFTGRTGGVTAAQLTRIDAAALKSPHVLDAIEMPGERVMLAHKTLRAADGSRPLQLEARLYRPAGTAPAPLAVFSHGSDIGRDLDNTPVEYREARWLTERGYAVLVPMRRGRGRSEGVYGEADYVTDRTGRVVGIGRGLDEAVEDLDSAIAYARTLPFVAPGPVLLVGQSRGGLLSVVYAGRMPAAVKAVISFAGGWLGGSREVETLNTAVLETAGRGAGSLVPQLWLYAERDSFTSEGQIRLGHAAFIAAGGQAELVVLKDIPGNGHFLRNFPGRWHPLADTFLRASVK